MVCSLLSHGTKVGLVETTCQVLQMGEVETNNWEFHKVNVLTIEMSEEDIMPEWFDHYNEGGSMSLWIRNEFPDMALSFAVGIGPRVPDRQVPCLAPYVIIDGKTIPDKARVFWGRIYGRFTLHDVLFFPGIKYEHSLLRRREWHHMKISSILIPE
ncbi:uncharacterized protein LOC129316174 [Prosopis cineraria]|uniref:uncharacterized protein LOC129316174 n=1 Tax=Prosopis cineraria TaxID=364024 RepID=UPI00240F73FD|nr:uncharacterized protein LOC129316174 [Prosopis cineraria]